MGIRIARFLAKNVLAVIAIVLALGGTAYAGFLVSSNSQIGPNTVAGHNPPAGKHSNLFVNSVTTQDLGSGAVTTGKLANGAVTSGRIAAGAVSSPKVADGSIAETKLADGAVTSTKLADGAVTNSKIGAGAVTNSKIGAGAVTNSKLGVDSVGSANVAPNSLTLSDLNGTDRSGSIAFTLSAGHCGTLGLSVSGAVAGQVALLSWTGTVPPNIVLGPLKVVSSTSITVRACNLGSTSFSGSGIGVRIVTFG
ncbi:MAG TPA: hypothetical protein VID47_19165 [Actinomycetota bacterium]